MQNKIIKEQFNKQAEKFASWSVSKNQAYLQGYFDFCDIRPADRLLDVACGPGDFTIFTAKKVLKAQGVDISDKELEIANRLAKEFGLDNAGFDCADVENLPYEDNSFSIVVCKSSFHHFTRPNSVFKEMIRCCEIGGKISINDIAAYEDKYVNDFFETFDRLVDISHNKTLSEQEFNKLYLDNKIKKTGDFRISVDLNIKEYIEHARQNTKNKIKIRKLLNEGINDNRLSDFLFTQNGELYFKRPVYLIIGKKCQIKSI
jgi:ubiquinone/menaquinone biosynthesis C-methylase UbiE